MSQLLLLMLATATLHGQQTAVTLTPGSPVTGRLGVKQSARYALPVTSGEFFRLTAIPGKTDITLSVYRQDGTGIVSVNRWAEGPEDFFFFASANETFTVSVFNRGPGEGDYQLRAEVRRADETDRACAAAFQKSYIERAAVTGPRPELGRKLLPILEPALPDWRRCGNRSWEVFTLVQLSFAHSYAGNLDRAIAALSEGVAIQRSLAEPRNLAINLSNLGTLQSNRGNHSAAIASLEEAVQLRRGIDDVAGVSVSLHNLAYMLERSGDRAKAREAYMQSLAVRRAIGDTVGAADTMSNLATFHSSQGEYQVALDYAVAALRVRTETGNKEGQASNHTTLGRLYFALGDFRRADEFFTKALEFYEQAGNPGTLAMILTEIGSLKKTSTGDPQVAVPYYLRALELRRKTGIPMNVANAQYAVCDGLLEANQWEKAKQAGEESRQTAQQIGYTAGIGNALYCLGRISFVSGNAEQAASELRQAAEAFAQSTARDRRAETLAVLAKVEASHGRLQEALAAIDESNRSLAGTRESIASTNLRATLRGKRAGQIDLHTDILMRLHQSDPGAGFAAKAFLVSESWRARALVESIAEAGGASSMTARERQQEEELLAAIGKVQRELLRDGLPDARKSEIRKQLTAAESELELFRVGLRRQPSAAGMPELLPVLDESQARKELLGEREAVLFFALGETRSYAWLLTREAMRSVSLPPKKEVAAAVASYRAQLTRPVSALTVNASLTRLDAEGRKLHAMLIAPFATDLAQTDILAIIPDGVLAYLPFEALPGAGAQRMIERFRISYAPSLSVVAALRARQKSRKATARTLLAFADPAYPAAADAPPALAAFRERGVAFTRLPSSRTEVMGIRALYKQADSRLYLGEEAQEYALKQEALDSFRYLHFAAHGYLDEQRPARSGILLLPGGAASEDGILQVEDILRLRLNADLVTLSACQSGVGEVLDGEGVMGLSRAFLQAGAQGVVVSLWNVNDAATAELMRTFHAQLKTGVRRDEALRRAKLSLLRKPASPWRHPYFWAPFAASGDWAF